MTSAFTRIAVALAAAATMVSGCGTAEAEHPIIPDTAPAIVPSLSEFLAAWNLATDHTGAAWRVDGLPPVSNAPAFEQAVVGDLDLVGYLNPATKGVVLVSLFARGAPADSAETLHDAASVLVQATSPARPADVTAVIDGLGLDSVPTGTTGQVMEVVRMDRVFRLQRFPTVVVVTVTADEPWDFLGTPHEHDNHQHDTP
jgi:hypothetical protein